MLLIGLGGIIYVFISHQAGIIKKDQNKNIIDEKIKILLFLLYKYIKTNKLQKVNDKFN
ncbi:hypothetical protein [Candidatus Phytoplasma gossypii]|uniref:Uncharacterized protein n=1 Tax=Candidatus Phytoplasma gossypii TaxID=2982629 RepID=A0ABT9D0U3_9MOLU|nr:hypothetical protein ['Gossypium sp.' phytoplasma]MDO8057333.1 hypothetical protein ['Gossypium sp.' phytoplasma]